MIDPTVAAPVALALNRVALGTFFAISGYHKLFNRTRHASIAATMKADHVPLPRVNEWFVPCVEFAGGLTLAAGFHPLASSIAALLLFCVCFVATCVDGVKRIPGYQPLDKADALDDLLYLPEVLYCIMLLIVAFVG